MTFALLLSALLLAGPEPTWKTATLDGEPVSGALLEITPQELKLQTIDGPKAVPLARLLALLPTGEVPIETPFAEMKPAVWIEFVDGSRVPAMTFESVKGKVKIGGLDGKTLEPSLKSLAVVRFTEAWDPTFVSGREGAGADRLGVKKKSGVDFLEGIIGDVSKETVNFTLDGDNLPVNRAKVDALVYVQRATGELPDPLCVLDVAGGWRLAAKSIVLGDKGLTVATLSEATVDLPLSAVKKWDFSAGKLQYVGDMTPESTKVTPFIEIPKELPLLREYFQPRIDRGRDDPNIRLDGKVYAKGLSLHSKTELTYRLPPKSNRFLAIAGIDDSVGNEGNVVFRIMGDGKELYSGVFKGSDKALPLDVDVAGVRKLTLIVDYGEDLDVGDYFDLADARIVK